MSETQVALHAIAARCKSDEHIHGSPVHLDREYLLALALRLVGEAGE